ncbi:hypothetical protein [Thetidibacter halocola]|nr:hypothetical protein [Thetidibacter halocola]
MASLAVLSGCEIFLGEREKRAVFMETHPGNPKMVIRFEPH